jgi:hypothetical protein
MHQGPARPPRRRQESGPRRRRAAPAAPVLRISPRAAPAPSLPPQNVELRAVLAGQYPDLGLPPKQCSAAYHLGLMDHYMEGEGGWGRWLGWKIKG